MYARELGNEVPRHFALNPEKTASPSPDAVDSGGDVAMMEQLTSDPSPDAVDSGGDVVMMEKPTSDSTSIKEEIRVEARKHCHEAKRRCDGTHPKCTGATYKKIHTKVKETKVKEEEEVVAADEQLCSPDDVIDKVTLDYSGEYVLSQLLQWVNGGIGQKKGLPDFYGCVTLPPITGCWEEIKCSEVKLPNYTKWNRKTTTEYDATSRSKLAEWIGDRYQRGSPWDSEVAKYFCPGQGEDPPDPTLPMGSPVIDYLVTGFDDNIRRVTAALTGRSITNEGRSKKLTSTDRLQSTVDEGMPAQAVANWVQCENPKCLKWRKLPWHVDVDLLPEKFFCKDNIWNPKSQSCEASEDEWDMDDAPIKFDTNENHFEVGGEYRS